MYIHCSLSDCQTTGLSDYWTVRLPDCQTTGLSDYWTVDYWTVGLSSCRMIDLTPNLHFLNNVIINSIKVLLPQT